MNTAPATSASAANVLPQVPSNSAPSSAGRSSSKFQDVFKSLPAFQDQAGVESQPAANSSGLPGKKKSTGDADASVWVPSTTAWKNAVVTKASLALPSDVLGSATRQPSQTTATHSATSVTSSASQALVSPASPHPAQPNAQNSTAPKVAKLLEPSTAPATGPVSAAKLAPVLQNARQDAPSDGRNAGESAAELSSESQQAPVIQQQVVAPHSSTTATLLSQPPAPPAQQQPLVSATSVAPMANLPAEPSSLIPSPAPVLATSPKSSADRQARVSRAPIASSTPDPNAPADPITARVDSAPIAPVLSQPNNLNQTNTEPAAPAVDQHSADSTGTASSNSSIPLSTPAQSFPLTDDNRAFSLQLPQAAPKGEPTSAPPAATAPAGNTNHAVLGSDQNGFVAPLASNAAWKNAVSSRNATPLPTIPLAPRDAHTATASDPTPRQPRSFQSTDAAPRASENPARTETRAHVVPSSVAADAPSAAPTTETSIPAHPVLPGGMSWLAATNTGSQPALAAQPAQARPTLTTTIPEIQPLAVETPRTTASNEILLRLDNGQTSAAVRVTDRAGTVNVSVHSPDQDLRNSLRSNLNELTTQLNAQGSKIDSAKAAPAQASSENRSQQGAQDQRSPNQQQPAPQGDRQSPRDRRSQATWLEELEQQTGASASNSGGKN